MSTWAKSTARIAWACAARNCRQVGPDRLRGGIDAGGLQDRPDGGGGDPVAESDELALDASVAPGGILSGHPQHQGPDRLRGGWAAGLSSRVGPAAGDEVGVPAQQGSGRHEPQPAQTRGQQPAQRAEDGAVEPGQRRAWVVSAQHGDLVTEHQDLDVLGCVGSGEQRQPAQHAGEQQVGESEGHSERSCCAGLRTVTARSAGRRRRWSEAMTRFSAPTRTMRHQPSLHEHALGQRNSAVRSRRGEDDPPVPANPIGVVTRPTPQ